MSAPADPGRAGRSPEARVGVKRFELRVYYEDTDLAGIVYYANYLKFIQDRLTVTTELAAISGARADLVQQVWRDATPLVQAEVRIVCLGADGRPARIPGPVRPALARLAPGADAP